MQDPAIVGNLTGSGACLTYDQIRQIMVGAQSATIQNAGVAMLTAAGIGMIAGLIVGSLVVYLYMKYGQE